MTMLLIWKCYPIHSFALYRFWQSHRTYQRCTNHWVSLQGLSLLAMSTPPILSNAAGNCGAYKPDCIGDAQMVLFYTALAFLAIGISGHITSLDTFLKQQDSKEPMPWQAAGGFIVILLAIVGFIAIQFIKPWSVRFGMPAICTVVATFLFTTGSCSYKRSGPHPQGSPLTTIFRVFVASASNIFRHRLPDDNLLPQTHSLRFSVSHC